MSLVYSVSSSMLKFGVIIILVVFLSVGKIQARCCIPKPINCYECDSRTDRRCKDPFNFSALPEEQPPKYECTGCCVKWVRNSKTPREIIRRTCITKFQVNLFMIDRTCMKERSKTGHMCFCEDDVCNNSSNLSLGLVLFVFILIICYFS